ncbi:MAG TPA: hypothetical protein VGP26_31425 [Actinophytocola sp.]|jgi:hypothetical protein|nr:hypothetical protein [Actinophytocola sp.]
MSGLSDAEGFVNALLGNLASARARGDDAEVERLLNYTAQEAGQDVAAIVRAKLDELPAGFFASPGQDVGQDVAAILKVRFNQSPLPPDTSPPGFLPPEVRPPVPPTELPPSNNRRLVVFFSSAVALLLVVVVVLVVVLVTRTSTTTATTNTATSAPTAVQTTSGPSSTAGTPSTSDLPPAPASASPTAPDSGYTMAINRQPITMGTPDVSCQMTLADLDSGSVRVNGEDEDTDDLLYWHCSPVGLQRWNAQFMGNAPAQGPRDSQECAQFARSDAVSGSIEPKDLEVGQSFCVITDEENIASLKLTGKPRSGSEDPNLKFELTVWKRS